MKSKLLSPSFILRVAAGLAVSVLSANAQSVVVSGTLTDVADATPGVFDYTLTLHNTGTEAVGSLWFGWTLSGFNVQNPTAIGVGANLPGWTGSPDASSIQYLDGTPIPSGGTGTFLFHSTSTPASFTSGAAGQSVAYGVNSAPFAFVNSGPNSFEFTPSVVPEPSTLGLLAVGSIGFLGALRRKLRGE